MADTTTAHYGLVKPQNSASDDTWGTKFNGNLDSIDSIVYQLRADLTSLQNSFNASQASTFRYIPQGTIVAWGGIVSNIPAGWHLCDGTSGTVDLRDKFIMGAGLSYAPGAYGGSNTATPVITVAGTALTVNQLPSHSHPVSDPGHLHGTIDPGHNHYYRQSNESNVGASSGGGANQNGYNSNTGDATTGISIKSAVTGVTIQNTGNGAAHTHGAVSSAIDIRSPYLALCYIQKINA